MFSGISSQWQHDTLTSWNEYKSKPHTSFYVRRKCMRVYHLGLSAPLYLNMIFTKEIKIKMFIFWIELLRNDFCMGSFPLNVVVGLWLRLSKEGLMILLLENFSCSEFLRIFPWTKLSLTTLESTTYVHRPTDITGSRGVIVTAPLILLKTLLSPLKQSKKCFHPWTWFVIWQCNDRGGKRAV